MDINISGPRLKGVPHEVETELDGGEGHHKKHLEDRHADQTEIVDWCETGSFKIISKRLAVSNEIPDSNSFGKLLNNSLSSEGKGDRLTCIS